MKLVRSRIAYFSPVGPDRSGVADYSEELLPYLAEHFEIDLFADGAAAAEPTGAADAVHRAGWDLGVRRILRPATTDPLPLLPDYDAVLYHIGNSISHVHAYRALMRHPGLVVLHDVSLAHLVLAETRDLGRGDSLLSEMRVRYGDDAAEAVRRAWYGDVPPPWESAPLRYPLFEAVLDKALAVLVHSEFARDVVAKAAPGKTVIRLDHHAWPPGLVRMPAAEGEPGGAAGGRVVAARAGVAGRQPPAHRSKVTFLTAGFLSPAKQIDLVLRALAILAADVDFEYRLVGEMYDEPGLRQRIATARLFGRVTVHGRVSKAELYRHLAEADVCVNLRHPNHGETSGIVLRALACGCPVVVSASGWFLEIPEPCAVKVATDDGDPAERLADALRRVGKNPTQRATMGAAAARYAADRHPRTRALGYVGLIAAAWHETAGVQATASLDRALAFCGLEGRDGLAREARATLEELQRSPPPVV